MRPRVCGQRRRVHPHNGKGLSTAVGDDVRRYLGKLVYDTEIPRNVRISEAPSHGLPVLLYDRKCAGSEAYAALAVEFEVRLAAAG